jgi:uncharacterized protein YcfJ
MKSFKRFALAAAMMALGAAPAFADACSGHDHDTGTALGAVGGAAIGGLASHSVGGAIVGGVAGGFAGNAIARSSDCNHHREYRRHRERDSYYLDRHGRLHYR